MGTSTESVTKYMDRDSQRCSGLRVRLFFRLNCCVELLLSIFDMSGCGMFSANYELSTLIGASTLFLPIGIIS